MLRLGLSSNLSRLSKKGAPKPPSGTRFGYALDLNGTDEYVTAPHNYKSTQLAANNSFVDWTAGIPNSWTKQGTSNGTNYIEESPADAIHIVSDGATMGVSQNILTVGERYLVEVEVTVNSGSIKVQLGGSGSANVINSTGTKIIDSYCDGTDGNLFLVRNAACNVVVSEIRVYRYVNCLDVTSTTNQITNHNNWNFEQATGFSWATGGNHAAARSSSNPKKGAYSLRATVTGAGDSTTNFISLPSSAITALNSGDQYAFHFQCYPDTADVTLNWSIGDKTGSITLTQNAFNSVRSVFSATASTVNQPIKIWFSKACSAYMDLFRLVKKQDFALSVWFKLSGTPTKNFLLFSAVVDNAGVDDYGIDVGFFGTATLYATIYSQFYHSLSNNSISDTNWHLATFVYSGTAMKLYIDGVNVDNYTFPIAEMGWPNSQIIIGKDVWGDTPYGGQIGEIQYVRFDNLALSDFDAAQYFAAGIPKSYTGGVPVIDLHMKWAGSDDAAMFTNAGTYNGTFSGVNVSQANDQVQASTTYITRD
ncbi:MAG: LamG domain-containing protein [Syntrophomonadaceae bacterium]